MTPRLMLLIGLLAGTAGAASSDVTPQAALDIQSPTPPRAKVLYSFDHDRVGMFPAGFHAAMIGSGAEAKWVVGTESMAPSQPHVLAQLGRVEPGENFAVIFPDQPDIQDADVSVKFKALSGETVQGVAVIYRYRNAGQYYVLFADAQNDELAIYRPKKGKLKKIDYQQVIVSPNVWHALRLIFVANTFRVYFDGELVMAGRDKANLDAGKIGLATPGDAASAFDDFSIAPPKPVTRPKKP